MLTSCQKIVTSQSLFGFLANLEQSGGRIPDTESAKVMFSVIVTFCLTKTKNRTKKSLTELSHYCFQQRYIFGQKVLIFCKKMLTSAKLRGARHQQAYFLKLNMSVYFRAKFEVPSIILTGFRQEGGGRVVNFTSPSPTSKQSPKKPTHNRVNMIY